MWERIGVGRQDPRVRHTLGMERPQLFRALVQFPVHAWQLTRPADGQHLGVGKTVTQMHNK